MGKNRFARGLPLITAWIHPAHGSFIVREAGRKVTSTRQWLYCLRVRVRSDRANQILPMSRRLIIRSGTTAPKTWA